MPESSLATTNLFLGIMATVSVLEAVVLAVVAFAAWKAYGRALEALTEARQQIEPLAGRVHQVADRIEHIADDVEEVTSGVVAVARKTRRIYGMARGVGAAYRIFVRRDSGDGGPKEKRS